MKLKEIRPILYTNQIKETVEFYTKNLGFSCAMISEEAGWAVLKRDHIEFSLSFPNAHLEFSKPSFTGSFYVMTEGVDELWDELKDKVKICYPLETFEYGMREFAVYDNNEYVLQFGQEV
jgi:hypothetical protein